MYRAGVDCLGTITGQLVKAQQLLELAMSSRECEAAATVEQRKLKAPPVVVASICKASCSRLVMAQ